MRGAEESRERRDVGRRCGRIGRHDQGLQHPELREWRQECHEQQAERSRTSATLRLGSVACQAASRPSIGPIVISSPSDGRALTVRWDRPARRCLVRTVGAASGAAIGVSPSTALAGSARMRGVAGCRSGLTLLRRARVWDDAGIEGGRHWPATLSTPRTTTTFTRVRAAAPDHRGRARSGDARRQRPARSARPRDGAGGARRLVVRRLRHLPLGSPPGQPPRAADDDRRDAVAARADDDARPESRRVHRGALADRPLGRRVRPVPAVVPDRPPHLPSRPRDRRHLPVRDRPARVPVAPLLGARERPERAGHRGQRERRPRDRHDPAGPDLARFRAPRHRPRSALAAIQRPGPAPDGARPRGRRRDPPAVGVVDPLLVRDVARAVGRPDLPGPDRDPDRGPVRDAPVPDGPRRRRGPRRRAGADPDAGPPPRCPRQRAR